MASTRVGALAALLLVASGFGGAPVVGSPTAEAWLGTGVGADGITAPVLVGAQLAPPETDNTITRIRLAGDGSAEWELRIRTRLESEAAVEEYRTFQARFRANRSRFVDEFSEGVTGIVANARAVTGREMSATGFRATTSIQTVPRRWGVVVYEFRWDGFAAVEGDRLVVGDVFEGGLFIAEGDALEVVGPSGYRVESADPPPDESGNGTVAWQGREDFADGRPRVVFAAAGVETTGLPSSDLLGAGLLLAVVLLVGLGVRRWGRRPGPADGGGAERAPSGDGAATAPLLTDEDHVREALSSHGGRMRQSEIKEALDWSRSKTSRVLRRMEEAGTVRKLQLGRENVIDLADDEAEDVG